MFSKSGILSRYAWKITFSDPISSEMIDKGKEILIYSPAHSPEKGRVSYTSADSDVRHPAFARRQARLTFRERSDRMQPPG